jgi:serine/threonine protein kinase/WD40 repeat protein
MSEPDDPTRTQHPSPDSRSGPTEAERAETLNASPSPDPPTASAFTHSQTGEPETAPQLSANSDSAEPIPFIPGFDIIRELGSGGMGVVYEARQTRLNRLVALKVLRGLRGSTQDVVRFLTEAEAVAAVKHPHVVQVFEFGQEAGRPFMALELLTGGTLADRLRSGGRLDAREAGQLVVKLADAVQAAHDLGIVHRDLKPSNILIENVDRNLRTTEQPVDQQSDPATSTLVPKIADFGLAKRTGGVDLTRTQAVMGTPAYMAPEQAKGEAKFVGPAADVWALGVILYECMTGKRPFDADDTWSVLRKVTDEAPLPPRSHVPGLPRDLELIALKCMEKKPADRYPSAAALADDLTRFLAGKPVSVRPAGPSERFVKWCRRNPVVAGFSVALIFVALLGFAGITWAWLEAKERGVLLANANNDLNTTLTDLKESRDDLAKINLVLEGRTHELTKSRNELGQTAKNLAATANDLAEARETTEDRRYLSNVALAHQLWKSNDLQGMRAALGRCPADRMQWEWDYLRQLSVPELAVYETDSLPVALAYSPDGKLLAHYTLAGTLSVRELSTGRVRFAGELPVRVRNRALAFRPDSKELAVATSDEIRLIDLVAWKEAKVPPKQKPAGDAADSLSYVALGYTTEGQLLGASTSRNPMTDKPTFTIRDVFASKTVATLDAWEEPANGVIAEIAGAEFSPDGTRFAASAVGGLIVRKKDDASKIVPFRPVVMVWEIKSAKLLAQAECSSATFGDIAFTSDSQSVGFGGRGNVRELDPGHKGGLVIRPAHTGMVIAVAFDRNNQIWSGGEDKLIRAHNRTTGDERFVIRGCPRSIIRLAISPDGREIAAASGEALNGNGAVIRFDLTTLAADTWRSAAGRNRVSFVTALAPDGSRFAACDFAPTAWDDGGHLILRKTAGGQERAIKAPGTLMSAMFSTDGSLATLDRNNQIRIFDADGKQRKQISVPNSFHDVVPSILATTPDGKTLVAIGAGREMPMAKRGEAHAQLVSWDANTSKPGPSADTDLTDAVPPDISRVIVFPTACATDLEGKLLAATFMIGGQVGGRNRLEFRGAIVVWDLTTTKEVFRRVTSEPLRAVGFDPQGRVVAAGGLLGGVVQGWDVATGKEVLSLRGHTKPILSFAFGPNGRLATGGLDNVVKLWDLPSQQEILTLDGFAREVTHLAFTKDNHDLVVATGLDMVTLMMGLGVPTEWPPAEVRIFRGPR